MPLEVLTNNVANNQGIERVNRYKGLRKPNGQGIIVYKDKLGQLMVCDEEDYERVSKKIEAFKGEVTLQELRDKYGQNNVLYDTENLR